jgi:putative transposase
MARPPRLFVPGIPSHVRLRGNDRQDIFRDDGDRMFFLRCLADAAARHEMTIHAYVLMTNHVHMLVTGASASSIAKTVQSIGRRYVRFFNDRRERTGTLWEGRYWSDIVDSDAYVLACQRYIELNPVRAALALAPDKYHWSSCQYHAWGFRNDLVTPHPVYLELGANPIARQDAYRKLFDIPIPNGMLACISGGQSGRL